jgi:hypothetical protein
MLGFGFLLFEPMKQFHHLGIGRWRPFGSCQGVDEVRKRKQESVGQLFKNRLAMRMNQVGGKDHMRLEFGSLGRREGWRRRR